VFDRVTGAFLTSCDVYFSEKDSVYPVAMEIRDVINGQPGPKILPFGRKTLQANEVSTSTDGSVATTFTFDSPVYVQGGQNILYVCWQTYRIFCPPLHINRRVKCKCCCCCSRSFTSVDRRWK
jgi:hypothetical protein